MMDAAAQCFYGRYDLKGSIMVIPLDALLRRPAWQPRYIPDQLISIALGGPLARKAGLLPYAAPNDISTLTA
jgi:hypothetical protein